MRASPGIYQQMIDKQYELRVTVMGETTVAAAIYSQQDGPTVNWRYEGGRGDTNLRQIALEPALQAQCIAVCCALCRRGDSARSGRLAAREGTE